MWKIYCAIKTSEKLYYVKKKYMLYKIKIIKFIIFYTYNILSN